MSKNPKEKSRADWMRETGVPMATDTAHRIVDTLARYSDAMMPEMDSWLEQAYHPSTSEVELHERFGPHYSGYVSMAKYLAMGVRGAMAVAELGKQFPEHLDADNKFLFTHGLTDQDFTWHFSPCIASQVAQAMEVAGAIPPDSVSQMTLSDWADMMDTEWFHEMMHDSAFTANGVHEAMGSSPDDYGPGAMAAHYRLEGAAEFFSIDGRSASLSPAFSSYLKGHIQKENYAAGSNFGVIDRSSIGCPVAKKNLTPDTELQAMHFEQLSQAGIMRARKHKDRIVYEQKQTPIDRMLDLLTASLRHIESKYGTPVTNLVHDTEDGVWRSFQDFSDRASLGVFAEKQAHTPSVAPYSLYV